MHDHSHPHLNEPNREGQSDFSPEETKALLGYMAHHNEHHAEELENIAFSVPGNEARQRLLNAAGMYEAANCELRDALELLELPSAFVSENTVINSSSHSHSHVHDPKEKKRQIVRLSRVIGHLEYVRRMLEDDEDCSNVLMQISAARSALSGLGKEIITDHMSHCISHAIEDGDSQMVDDFQKAILKYI